MKRYTSLYAPQRERQRERCGREGEEKEEEETDNGGRKEEREGGGGEEKGEREDKWTNKQYQEQKEKLKRIGREV